MNIQFKNTEEYKNLMQDFKRESLKVKNKNIHYAAMIRKMKKEHSEFEIVDEIVKTFLSKIGYQIEEEDEENDFNFDVNVESTKNKSQVDIIYQICRKAINVLKVGVKNVYEFISYSLKRHSSRHNLNKKHKELRKFMVDMIKSKIKDEKTIKDNDVLKKIHSKKTIGMWRVSKGYSLMKLTASIATKINELFHYFFRPELAEENKPYEEMIKKINMDINGSTYQQIMLLQEKLKFSCF